MSFAQPAALLIEYTVTNLLDLGSTRSSIVQLCERILCDFLRTLGCCNLKKWLKIALSGIYQAIMNLTRSVKKLGILASIFVTLSLIYMFQRVYVEKPHEFIQHPPKLR